MNKHFTIDEALAMIAHEVVMSKGQRAFARDIGVSVSFVNDVLKKRRAPTDVILNAVGLKRKTVYVVAK